MVIKLVVGFEQKLYHPGFKEIPTCIHMSTYGRKNVGISFEGRVIQKIMQIIRQTVGDQSAITLKWLLIKLLKCDILRRVIMVVDHFGKQSAIGRQTVGDRLRT